MIDRTLAEGNAYARLLSRIRNEANRAGIGDARRIHLVVAIDRLLARLLVSAHADSWVIKGGFANQLRRPQDARFTEDIDLRIESIIATAPALLADAFATQVDDLFSYEITSGPAPLEGPPEGGSRFVVVARYAGSRLVTFKIDISVADPIVGTLERHLSDPVLQRLGFVRSMFPVYPVAQHVAEKLHALTLPREQENTRARDLVDLVWFAEHFSVESTGLINAAVATFRGRATHRWPPVIEEAPASWARPYRRYRDELGLLPAATTEAALMLRLFFAPVFAGATGLRWDPGAASWTNADEEPAATPSTIVTA